MSATLHPGSRSNGSTIDPIPASASSAWLAVWRFSTQFGQRFAWRLLPVIALVIGLASGLASGLANAQAQAADRSVVTTERVRAELLAHAPDGIVAGRTFWLGLRITHQPQWHTYWRNPGDSGLPTTLDWTLPQGLGAGEVAWPVPQRLPVGHLVNYGYEGTVLLPVPLTVTQNFRPSALSPQLKVVLKAQWLACKTECIPEAGEFELQLPVQGSTALHGAQFQAAIDTTPRNLPANASGGGGGDMSSGARVEGQILRLELRGLPLDARGKTLALFPETSGVIDNAAAVTQSWQGAIWNAQVALSPHREASPGQMAVVVAEGGRGWRADLPVAGTWPAAFTSSAGVSPALAEALQRNAEASKVGPSPAGWLLALLGAFFGGLLLNLMPCVFPVLAVKVVGFARQGADYRTRTLGGLAYTVGVVAAFIFLGGIMLALRAGGEQLGWGFQLQSPAVVAALAALFTLIGLNLSGLFEFGSMLPASWGGLQLRHPLADALLSGVLAVAIASPCTAPFMGASLGAVVTLPPAQGLTVFAALGLGMAMPYLLFSAWPAAGHWLPRSGPWMDLFRRLMAFPMFATVVWLVWVLGQQSGIDGAAALLALLVSLALLAWALGLAGRPRHVMGLFAASVLAAACFWLGPRVLNELPMAAGAPQGANASGPDWQPWSTERVKQALEQGRPVFVDFTAAWCVTCQYNKATTLSDPSVLSAFAARRVLLLRADWTRRDPVITAALGALGRNGVPVYQFQAPGRAPVLLSEVLSPTEIQQALSAP